MKIKCSLTRCTGYDYEKVYEALSESIENLGGFAPYIAKGERVLLKVNLVMKKRPEEAATTHPVFVKALATLLLEYGAEVLIGDSPGGPFISSLMNSVYSGTGMSQVSKETGARLNVNYNSCTKDNPDGFIMKHLTLTDMINDVDKVISVAKLKAHAMMTFTGAVKNMFGMVPGLSKAEYHLNMPNYEHFADMLIDVCLCCKPVLSFMDGIVSMEGNGPTAGDPVNTNVILASESPYHLDQAACGIIDLSTDDVPVLKRLKARGIIGEIGDIDFAGGSIEEFYNKDFKISRGSSLFDVQDSNFPGFIKTFVGRCLQTRPHINLGLCVGCGICKDACPANIIDINAGKKAVINYKKCIRCYCCQELCPQKAVKMHRPTLAKLLKI